ncbi:MAG: site-2 protease family protein, partial [Halonotius sp.]
LFAMAIAYKGPANPADESRLDRRRLAIGIATFAVGLLCFMLVPIQVQS